MSAALAKKTVVDLVNSIAWNFGENLTEREAMSVVWNHTGFPSFFLGEPEACMALQVWEYFVAQASGCVPCACCGRDAVTDICEPCAQRIDKENK